MAAPCTDGLESIDSAWTESRRRSNSLTGERGPSHWGMGMMGPDNVFSRNSESRRGGDEAVDDEEALTWAALEKLPTYDRLRTTILQQFKGSKVVPQTLDLRNIGPQEKQNLLNKVFSLSSTEDDNGAFLRRLRQRIDRLRTTILQQFKGSKVVPQTLDLRNIGPQEKQNLLNKVFSLSSTEDDNGAFLRRLRQRIDRVDIKLPTIEVRYKDITVEAKCYVGGRALPTLFNAARNAFEGALDMVGISLSKKAKITILRNVSGIIKPGRMTLLLGPPASGKTSLLLSLAGRLGKDLKAHGEISYNGYNLNEFVPQKTSAYISQNDLHVGEMTVRETLDFSARCQGVAEKYDLLTELIRREKELGVYPEPDVDFFMKATAMKEGSSGLVTDYNLKILGLEICSDTIVGDNMRRGISGGQKKRVTTGEMIVGPMKTLFMDEISTGLDSSTTFQIIRCLGDIAHVLENTILISLLQPAPETFNLFDDIILLSEGQIVYHGPREDILEFFESCGYRSPERKGIADFLQEVTSRKDQQQYWADKSKPYQFTSVKDFAEAFKKFHVGVKLEEELSQPFDKKVCHPAALSFNKYSVSTMELFKANFERELLLAKRNSFVYIFKSVQICIMALIAMTVYLRTKMTRDNLEDAQVFSGALFFGIVSTLFNGFAELSMTIDRLPVFYKQRDLLFFPAWSFSLSKFIQSIPISLLESFIWLIITYYVIGFASEAGRFFRQFLLFFLVHQMAAGLFRLIAGLSRTMVIANTGGSLTLLIIFVLGGFLIPRTSIEPWWIWGYWISPLSYAQNGVDVNEFLAPEWNKIVDGDTLSLGLRYLHNAGFFSRGYWYWISIAALIGYTLFFNLAFTVAISYLNPLGKAQAVISEEALAEQHAFLTGEELPTESSKKKSVSERSLSLTNSPSLSRQPRRTLSNQPEIRDGGDHPMTRTSSSTRGRRSSNSELAREALRAVNEAGELKKGMILPFQPLSISFDSVQYFVDMPAGMKQQGATEDRLQLLQNVTGSFRPGVLTALVGVSGAGKSTLMDVLSGRKTGGYIEGDIRISGFPKKQDTFARISGYCEQNDIHSPQVTVHESLIYSAWLRLDRDIDEYTKAQFVEEVMDLVELQPLRHAVVGLPGVTGLSTEQRKRLTIAVELVANPSIIFMDEPTSGLDARAAAIVMRTVRNTVDTGRTVVCTIHQPSIDIFEAFDELLLMKRGGQVIYAGPLGRHSHKLVEYFESLNSGVPKLKEGYNPATWMLEVSSPAVEQRLSVDFAELYEKSALYQQNKALVQELSIPSQGSEDIWFSSQYSQSFLEQVRACLWKQNLTYWRSPDHNNVRFMFTLIAAILFGTIFWQAGKKRQSETHLFSIIGAMYGAVMFIGINNCSTVQPVVDTERTVFYRERAAGMYSAIPYAIGQVLIEVPYCLAQTIVYAGITYSMIALEWTAAKFFWNIFFMFFTFLYFTFYGMMAVGITPNHNISAIVAAFFYAIFNLFSGFLIPKTRIPAWWIWYYWICPVAWTMYGLVVSQFGDLDNTPLQRNDGSDTTISQYVKEAFGFEHSFLPVVATMLVVFPLIFAGVFVISIKFLNFQTR